MTTQHIQNLQPGQGAYAFFLNAQGRIQADVNVVAFEDHFLLDTEPEQRSKIYEHLDRYIIADDVTLEDVTDSVRTVGLEGPEAAQVLAGLGAPVPEELWSHAAWGQGTVQRVPGGFRLFGDVPALGVARIYFAGRQPPEPQTDLAAVVGFGRRKDIRLGDPVVDDL